MRIVFQPEKCEKSIEKCEFISFVKRQACHWHLPISEIRILATTEGALALKCAITPVGPQHIIRQNVRKFQSSSMSSLSHPKATRWNFLDLQIFQSTRPPGAALATLSL